MDKNGDGKVDVKEFIDGFSMLRKPDITKHLESGRKSSLGNFCLDYNDGVGQELFGAMDKNKDGLVTKEELRSCLKVSFKSVIFLVALKTSKGSNEG